MNQLNFDLILNKNIKTFFAHIQWYKYSCNIHVIIENQSMIQNKIHNI